MPPHDNAGAAIEPLQPITPQADVQIPTAAGQRMGLLMGAQRQQEEALGRRERRQPPDELAPA